MCPVCRQPLIHPLIIGCNRKFFELLVEHSVAIEPFLMCAKGFGIPTNLCSKSESKPV